MLIYSDSKKIIFKSLIPGSSDSGSKLDKAYVEFVNGSPFASSDIATSDELKIYYQTLSSSTDKDYIRCNISSYDVVESPTGELRLKMMILVDSEEGVYGKTFGAASLSKVFAVSLAASQANGRDDILFGRFLYSVEEQLSVPDNGSIILNVSIA